MARKNLKSALASSLKAEDAAVRDRFEKAESLLSDRATPDTPDPAALLPPEKSRQAEQSKVIRDSFTLPAADYELINTIRQRCLDAAMHVTKSEVIRAGLHALTEMSDAQLSDMMASLEKVKTGRPSGKP